MTGHEFIKTGDFDSFDQLCDQNGEVVLKQCRKCGDAEAELLPECPVPHILREPDKPPFLAEVVKGWLRTKASVPSTRLGQYFIYQHCHPQYKNATLYYSNTALLLLEQLYAHYDWPL